MAGDALLLFGLLLGLVLTVAVAVDANDRGRSPIRWGLVVFVTGLVGAFVYLLVILAGEGTDADEPDAVQVCPNCSAQYATAQNYCGDCGEPLDEADEVRRASVLRSGSRGYCGRCKSRVALDADACPGCGAAFRVRRSSARSRTRS